MILLADCATGVGKTGIMDEIPSVRPKGKLVGNVEVLTILPSSVRAKQQKQDLVENRKEKKK